MIIFALIFLKKGKIMNVSKFIVCFFCVSSVWTSDKLQVALDLALGLHKSFYVSEGEYSETDLLQKSLLHELLKLEEKQCMELLILLFIISP